MFQESQYSDEQNLIAAFSGQLSKEYDERYFLRETKLKNSPKAFWKELSEGGYLGIIVKEDFGGVGLNTEDLGVFLYHMAKQGLASFQLINQLLCADIISQFGSDSQRDQLIPGITDGELWCYADLEHAQGRSLFDIAARAEKSGDHYVLQGQKGYAVCGLNAKKLIIAARTSDYDETNSQQGISLFWLDARSAGIEYSKEHLNVRLVKEREEMAATGDLFNNIQLENVTVPASNLIGVQDQGGDLIKRIASRKLLMMALISIGWGDRLLDKTITYANQRVIFKDSISSYQAVQHPMVLAKTDLEMAKLLAERAAQVFDQSAANDELLTFCSVAKRAATEAAFAVCDIAMQTHGGSGYDRDTGIISLWPLVSMSRLFPLNNDVILENFAEQVIGLPMSEVNTLPKVPAAEGQQNIVFEARTEREVKVLELLKKTFDELPPDSDNPMMNIMAQIMGGDLSDYRDMIMSESQGTLPFKLDIFRQYSMYGTEDATEGDGMAKYMAEHTPAKYGLSAMAMAAVSSGKDGANVVMSQYMPQLTQGKLFCYCITEPGAGTNTHKVSTVAVDEGDHYRLNGQKTFISAADTAYYMAVIARLEVDGKKGSVGTFVLEASTDGISMTKLDIAALGDPQFTVHFDDVILPKSALVGEKASKSGSSGISESVFYTLNLERIMIALGAIKVGQEGLQRAVKKAKQAQPFGPLLGCSSAIKQQLAQLTLKYELTNLALKKAGVAFDNKENPKTVGMFANMAKYLASTFADEASDVALQLYGIEGLDKEGDDIGGLCQVGRVLRTVPINNEMVLNFLAENLMGLPKSYQV